LSFLSCIQSFNKSGLSDTGGWRVVLDFSSPHTGHPVLKVPLLLQLAVEEGWPLVQIHIARVLELMLTVLGCGLSGCHSLDRVGWFSIERHGQNPPEPLLHLGQPRRSTCRAMLSALASHSCTLPHPCWQPGQRSHTFWRLPWVKSAGDLGPFVVGCHSYCILR
jgi:hypothetical protein